MSSDGPDRTIGYKAAYARIAGADGKPVGAATGLFLSQALYWAARTEDPDGFFKTQEEWEEETALTRREQDTARRDLVAVKILVTARKKVKGRVHFKIDMARLSEALANPVSPKRTNKDVQNVQTDPLFVRNEQPCLYETSNPVCTKRTDLIAQNEQTHIEGRARHSEMTEEITTEMTAERDARQGAPAPAPVDAARPVNDIRRSVPQPPDEPTVRERFKALGRPELATAFYAHYASVGWEKSGRSIRDWWPLVPAWIEREDQFTRERAPNAHVRAGPAARSDREMTLEEKAEAMLRRHNGG